MTAGLARIEQGERAVQFQRAMAQGMTALARGEPAAAHQAFTRAGTLQPASTEAAAALQQTARAAAAQAIEQAIEQARRAESDEAWREAVRHYDAALALDRDLVSVDDARRAAQARATLDARIEAYRADLLTLTADSARADATEVLAAARAVAHPGRRLTQQITALDNAVRRARTPVSVALHSNGTTAISIEQIGAFAPFTERTIELLPGRYRASGQRDGYRDVRVEFSVVPAAAAPIVTLQCEDELATGH